MKIPKVTSIKNEEHKQRVLSMLDIAITGIEEILEEDLARYEKHLCKRAVLLHYHTEIKELKFLPSTS